VGCCVDNLLHAAQQQFSDKRTFMLPPQHVELGALVQAIADEFGITNMRDLIRWQKDDWVEFNFGSYPPVHLPAAEAAGFRADSNLRSLVINSLV